MIDAVGTTLFTYSGSGQLIGEDGPFASDTITNIYWSRMRTNLTLIQPTGIWTNVIGYSGLNRLTNVLSSAGMFSYFYAEPSTRLTNLALPSGAYVNNVYDTMSRLTNSFLFNSTGTPLDGHVYQYDRENQRTNEVRADSSTLDFSYDNIGQLTIANSSVPSEDRGYSYDTAWNLNFRTNNLSLSTFVVNPKNELTNAFGQFAAYDANGNLIVGDADHNEYEYDDENRLIHWYHFATNSAAPASGDLRTDFVYDGLGRLRKRLEYTLICQAGSGTNETEAAAQIQTETENLSLPGNCAWGAPTEIRYVYDGWRVIQERDGNNTPTVSYTRGNDLSLSLEGAGGIGGLLARSVYTAGTWTSHADYYADGNGNITSLIDTNQSVVARYRYDPFGNIISKSGSLADANVYRFSSKEVHVNSGMYYYGFRFYEPNLQRWINRDPLGDIASVPLTTASTAPSVEPEGDDGTSIGDFFNAWIEINHSLYASMNNDPLNRIDRSGLKTCQGEARALQGNKNKIGQPGGFSGDTVGEIKITPNSAAVDPDQWGGKSKLRENLDKISGTLTDSSGKQVGSFKGITDVMGGTKPKGMEKEKNVRAALKKLNPGKLLLELPSASDDLGVVKVKLTVPDDFPCPQGTK